MSADSTAREIAERLAVDNWEDHCHGCITATWCAHFKQCLAETVPPPADAEARVRQEYEQALRASERFRAEDAGHALNRQNELSARLATAEQALKEYGKHKADCGVYRYEDNIHEAADIMYGCTCGLSAALGDSK